MNGFHTTTWHRTDAHWNKWLPQQPTSPHWYTPMQLWALIAAYLTEEQAGGRARTVREFVAEFNGLSAPPKQKAVTTTAGLSRAYLHDLVQGGEVNVEAIQELWAAMQAEARPVRPEALGILGQDHLSHQLTAYLHASPPSIRYKKIEGVANGLPFVLECAFGLYTDDYSGCGRQLSIGLNWTPVLGVPFTTVPDIFSAVRVDTHDPVVVLLHLACPRIEFTDRGKMKADLPSEITAALDTGLRSVTKQWTEAKKSADRQNRVQAQQLANLRRAHQARDLNIKDAAYAVMAQAYMKASANNTLPANARQIMYVARPLVLQLTGGKLWTKSSYFTQHLLPDFINDHPELTADWDVVFDARGRLIEPHTKKHAALGSLEVRRYMRDWTSDISEDLAIELQHGCPTVGPRHRYQAVLFVEKEGFYELLERAHIANRYDTAIMSTKGMSVTAARTLIERLSADGVTVLVLHDFDKSGFEILKSLQSDTRRYTYRTQPRIIDLGLRLEDVQAMQLESETVPYKSDVDPRIHLRECGATLEEANFLVRRRTHAGWSGERVELNAMDSAQFIAWLEAKLQAAGVSKVVPDQQTLEKSFRRAHRRAEVQRAINRALDAVDDNEIDVPDDLAQYVKNSIAGTDKPWDIAIWELVRGAG